MGGQRRLISGRTLFTIYLNVKASVLYIYVREAKFLGILVSFISSDTVLMFVQAGRVKTRTHGS
jgi:hypothetical protein